MSRRTPQYVPPGWPALLRDSCGGPLHLLDRQQADLAEGRQLDDHRRTLHLLLHAQHLHLQTVVTTEELK